MILKHVAVLFSLASISEAMSMFNSTSMMPKSSLAINMPSLTIVQASSPSLSSSFKIYVLSTTRIPVSSSMRTTPVLLSRTAALSSSIATPVSASSTTEMPPLSVTVTEVSSFSATVTEVTPSSAIVTEVSSLSATITEVSSLSATVTEVSSLSATVTPTLSSTPERSSSGRTSLVIVSSSATKPLVSSSSVISSTSTTSTTTQTSTAKPTPSVATADFASPFTVLMFTALIVLVERFVQAS